MTAPTITRSLTLNFVGDWGQANFHRVLGWLTHQFCRHAGPNSRTAIWSIRGGGFEAVPLVHGGEADLCIVTPDKLMRKALTGEGIFRGLPMPDLRALAVLPQNDVMLLAIDRRFGIHSFEELRRAKPALRIARSTHDGTNFIGYVAERFMSAHGISDAELESWGGRYVTFHQPNECLDLMLRGEVDAVLQEAIMTPWWAQVMTKLEAVPIPAEPLALQALESSEGLPAKTLRAGYWPGVETPLTTLDFSDFVVLVRADMPEDVAHLLTWCLVETRGMIEQQYRHLDPERSPLSYPLEPAKMAQPSIPLHPGARAYFESAGHLGASRT
jgi:uncharacterized protein